MLAPVYPAITRSDFEEMPEGPPYYQLIEGQLVMSPSPFTRHQRIVARLLALLTDHIEKFQLGEVFVAPLDVFLNDLNVYQPDLVFVSKTRTAHVTERGIEGVPDLCVEVLSKSTQKYDLTTKRKVYAQSGFKHYWVVDPDAKTLSTRESWPACRERRLIIGSMPRWSGCA